jgi:hypothetical protein
LSSQLSKKEPVSAGIDDQVITSHQLGAQPACTTAASRGAIDALTIRAKQLQQEAAALGLIVVLNPQGACAVLSKLADDDNNVDKESLLLDLTPAVALELVDSSRLSDRALQIGEQGLACSFMPADTQIRLLQYFVHYWLCRIT